MAGLGADLEHHRTEIRARRLELIVELLERRLAVRGPDASLERMLGDFRRELEDARARMATDRS